MHINASVFDSSKKHNTVAFAYGMCYE